MNEPIEMIGNHFLVMLILQCEQTQTNTFLSQIPKLHKHRPTPKTTYKQPKEQQVMDEIRDLNRRRAEVI